MRLSIVSQVCSQPCLRQAWYLCSCKENITQQPLWQQYLRLPGHDMLGPGVYEILYLDENVWHLTLGKAMVKFGQFPVGRSWVLPAFAWKRWTCLTALTNGYRKSLRSVGSRKAHWSQNRWASWSLQTVPPAAPIGWDVGVGLSVRFGAIT